MFILLFAILLLAVFIAIKLSFFIAERRREKQFKHDRQPNATNYNLSTLDKTDIDKMSKAEARDLIQKLREDGDHSALGIRDFYRLVRKMEG